jgi:TonB-dependent receptor
VVMAVSACAENDTNDRFGGLTKINLKTGVSGLAVILLMAATPAYAQDAEAPAEDLSEGAENDVIVVTGIRESLANAQKIKKDSDTVVDAITSEDIGALPDRSVTEALQRVPGVAINRFAGSNDPDHFSVEGSGVVIRGLNFVRSEFNGRTAFSAGVGGQALSFADVPSELLGSVIIAKNSTADMIEGGLAGTVNLNTRKPFDKRGFNLAFSAEANYGDFRKEWTPTFSGLLSNTWETGAGTFGLMVSGAYSRVKSRSDGLQITNFQTRDGRLAVAAFSGGTRICRNPLPGSGDTTTLPAGGSICGAASTAGPDGLVDPAAIRYAPVGGQFRTQEFDRKRDGFTVAGQFETIDKRTLFTAEYVRSHTTNSWNERTLETAPDLSEYGTYPLGCRQNANGPSVIRTNGTLGDGTTRGECPTGFTNYIYDDSGLFQAGYITNPSNGWRGNNSFVPIGGLQQSLARRQVEQETTNEDWSLHMRSELTDKLTLDLDAQYAKSSQTNLDVSVFGSMFADQELDLRGEYPTVIPHRPNTVDYTWGGADRSGISNSTDAQYFGDPRYQFWRAAMDHIEDSEGEQYAFKGDLEYNLGEEGFIRKIKVGARYSDRDQTVRYTTYNWGALSEVWAGDRPVNFADTGAAASAEYTFPNFFRGQTAQPPGVLYYAGDLIGDYAGFQTFATGVNQRWQTLGGSAGWVPLQNRNGVIAGTPFLPSDIQPIKQSEAAFYGMMSFGSDEFVGGTRLNGNIGLRYVHSAIQSSGSIGPTDNQGAGLLTPFSVRCSSIPPVGLPPGTPATQPGGICLRGQAGYDQLRLFFNGVRVADTAKNSYGYWLPSFNAKLGLSDDLIMRFAASRVLTRPNNDLLRNYQNIGIRDVTLQGESGNPNLLPATAWQFDLTAEWYFARVGSLTLNLFAKDVKNFFFQDFQTKQLTSGGITETYLNTQPNNFKGTGKIRGFEVAYQQTYDFLPGFLNGLGTALNYTYIKSKGLPNSLLNVGLESTIPSGNLPLEQLSKHNANATIFYEKGPISMRAAYNWRSKFLLVARDNIFPYYPIYNGSTGQLDASLFFNLSKNLKIGVQGVNLLNEVTETLQSYRGDPSLLAPRSYFMNDRRFSFIIRGNF